MVPAMTAPEFVIPISLDVRLSNTCIPELSFPENSHYFSQNSSLERGLSHRCLNVVNFWGEKTVSQSQVPVKMPLNNRGKSQAESWNRAFDVRLVLM